MHPKKLEQGRRYMIKGTKREFIDSKQSGPTRDSRGKDQVHYVFKDFQTEWRYLYLTASQVESLVTNLPQP